MEDEDDIKQTSSTQADLQWLVARTVRSDCVQLHSQLNQVNRSKQSARNGSVLLLPVYTTVYSGVLCVPGPDITHKLTEYSV